jgi:hypothetical protein
MIRLVLVALIAFSVTAPLTAAQSGRSRATVKVHAPKKRGPKLYQGNYNPNKGRPSIHRAKK